MKIAVLDDGIDKSDFTQKLNIRYNDSFLASDVVSHGLKVIATIEKYSSCSKEYYIYDIVHTGSISRTERIREALEEALDMKADMVIMCFTINKEDSYSGISSVCEQLAANGCIIVASAANRGGTSFPACLKSVIGVGRMAARETAFMWNTDSEFQVLGDISPEFIKFGSRRFMFNGTSKATARLAAFIAERMSEKKKSFKGVLQELEEILPHSCNNIIEELESRKYRTELRFPEIHTELVEKLMEYGCNIDDTGKNYYFEDIVEDIEEYTELFFWIEEEITTDVDITKLHYTSMLSTYALADYIGSCKHKQITK